jgi:hypothetical protein
MRAAQRMVGGFAAGIALVAVLAMVTLSQHSGRTALAGGGFPQSDLDMIKVMVSAAPHPVRAPSSPSSRARCPARRGRPSGSAS